MSTKGILKAGNKIQTNLTGASNYDLKVGGVSVSSATSSITLGPYEDDQFYELTVNSGAVSVSCYDALINGVTTSVSLADLGSAQSAGVNSAALVDGLFNIKSNGKYWELQNAGFKSRRLPVAAERLYGVGGSLGSGSVTGIIIKEAPADFDAVRLTIVSAPASNAQALQFTIAPSATFNKIGPVNSLGARIAETAVTWGSTDKTNPLNPGGGAATVTPSGASGSVASTNYVLSRIQSDIIPLSSISRADGGSKPLLIIKGYGAYLPADQSVEHAVGTTNDIQTVIGAEFSGYRSGAYLTSDPTYNEGIASSGGYWTQNGRMTVEVEYFLRGKKVINIGVTGDSTDQGWVDATAVPQFGGNINGYMRRFVRKLRDDGNVVGYSVFAQAGQRSFVTYNNAIAAVLSGSLTHLVIRPWSINDTNTGATDQVAHDALRRTQYLIDCCERHGVVPIILRPFAYGSTNNQRTIALSFVDSYKASGGLVLDLSSVVNSETTAYQLKQEYLTVNGSGDIVDQIHLNDLAHQDIANFIYTKCDWMFS